MNLEAEIALLKARVERLEHLVHANTFDVARHDVEKRWWERILFWKKKP